MKTEVRDLTQRITESAAAAGGLPRAILVETVRHTAEYLQQFSDLQPSAAGEMGLELSLPNLPSNRSLTHAYFKPDQRIDSIDTYEFPHETIVLMPGKGNPINPLQVSIHTTSPIPAKVANDITQAYRANWSMLNSTFGGLRHGARDNDLTGLPNRAALTDFLEYHAFRNGTRNQTVPAIVGVMVADLNGFKALNDTHGHAAGDDALKYFANVLEQATQDVVQDAGRAMVGRVGGDEFQVIVRYATAQELQGIVDRTTAILAQPDQGVGVEHRDLRRGEQASLRHPPTQLSGSYGFTLFSTEGLRPSEFHAKYDHWRSEADQHMYRMKQAKKNLALRKLHTE